MDHVDESNLFWRPTPTARQIPRSEMRSRKSRAIRVRCFAVITEFSGLRTKAWSQCVQWWICCPIWIWPFLLYDVDAH